MFTFRLAFVLALLAVAVNSVPLEVADVPVIRSTEDPDTGPHRLITLLTGN